MNLKERIENFEKRIAKKQAPVPLYSVIASLYSKEYRKYHNLEHITNCLAEFDKARHLSENPDALEMAILFHDIVYDTQKKANEEKSAISGYRYAMLLGLDEKFCESVKSLILATKHDKVPDFFDGKLICDIDLSIFGSSFYEFNEYGKRIREEYSFVPSEAFTQGRKKLLERFLSRKRIYYTDFFFDLYEKQARKNLERSLAKLQVSF